MALQINITTKEELTKIRIAALQAHKCATYAQEHFNDDRINVIAHCFIATESGVQPLCGEIQIHIEKKDAVALTLSSLYRDYNENYQLINANC